MSKTFTKHNPEAKRAELEELGNRIAATRRARTRPGWRYCRPCGENFRPDEGRGSRRLYCSSRCKMAADEETVRLAPEVREDAAAAWCNPENEADLPRVFKLDGEVYQYHLDSWYPRLRDYVSEKGDAPIENIKLWGVIGVDIDKRTWRDNVRFGAIMRALGFSRVLTHLHGRTWITYRRKADSEYVPVQYPVK